MSIVLARIDNRLIHGQVMEAWVPFVQADCIVVANNAVASSPLKRAMMEACVPRSIRVFVGSVGEAADRLCRGEFDSAKVLLLLENSSDALEIFREGVNFPRLNLGNMHAAQGKVAVSCTLCVDSHDIENLSDLEAAGVMITARCVPQDTDRNWRRLMQIMEKPERG